MKNSYIEIEGNLSHTTLKPSMNDTFMYQDTFSEDDTITSGAPFAHIVPEGDNLPVNLYVPEVKPVEITMNQEVDYAFSDISKASLTLHVE